MNLAEQRAEKILRQHPALGDLDPQPCGHWRSRHSHLYEFRSRCNAEERYLVKVITSGEKLHEAGAAVERERQRLEQVRSRVGPALLATLPEPLAVLPDAGAIVLRKLPGVPLDRILRRRANVLMGALNAAGVTEFGRRAGAWLREFQQATAQPPLAWDAQAFLALAGQSLQRCQGALQDAEVGKLQAALAGLCQAAAGTTPPASAVHGDFIPQNILVSGERIHMTDLENFQEFGVIYHDTGVFDGYLAMLESAPYYSAGALRNCRRAFLAACGVEPDDPLLKAHSLRTAILIVAASRGSGAAGAGRQFGLARRLMGLLQGWLN